MSPSAAPTPAKAWVPSGFAAASYNWAIGSNSFLFNNGTASRTFDNVNRQPMLNAVNVQLVKNGAIGGKVELEAGTNANVIASYPENIDSFDVTQLYLSGTSGQFTLIAGKFATLAGAEVIEDPNDTNISRSILFGFAVPFTHTGVRLTFAPSSLFSVIGGVNNGWDNLKGSGSGKTFEFGLAYTGPVFQVTAQGYTGEERLSNAMWSLTGNSPLGNRTLVDVVATYKTTPRLTFVGNYDYGQQQNASLLGPMGLPDLTPFGNPVIGASKWSGVAGYANYQLTPRLLASLRAETFNDGGGYRTGFQQHWRETTLTFGYAVTSQLLFRVEGRADESNQAVWTGGDGLPRNTMQSVAVQGIVKF
ncbi:MAG TPA: outer membrane beta-barrel protein [Candidatus Acidoferrum sp.]|nr:outer membrane beta-barrel protein [Candidatus Acidoferrum sp.]